MVRLEHFTPPGGQGARHTRPQRSGGVGGLGGVSMPRAGLSRVRSSVASQERDKSRILELLNFADLSSEEFSARRELLKYDLYVNS